MRKNNFLSYNLKVKKILTALATTFLFSCVSHAVVSGPPAGNPILNSHQYQRNSEMNIDTATIRTSSITTFSNIPNFPFGVKINTTTYTSYGTPGATRYFLYTLTSGMDCSGRTNGGKVTSTGSDLFCADDISGGGGGGASTLGVYQDGVQKSSPTAQINFLSSGGLTVTVTAASTATISLNGNSTNYIRNNNTLQSGSTAYPQFLYVGSSASIVGMMTASSATLSGLNANQFVLTDSNKMLWTKAKISLSTEVTGVLDYPNLTPNATFYIRNNDSYQTGARFIVSSGTFKNEVSIASNTVSLRIYNIRDILSNDGSVITQEGPSGEMFLGRYNQASNSNYGLTISSNYNSNIMAWGDWSYLNNLGAGSEYAGTVFAIDKLNNHIHMASQNANHGGFIGAWGPPFTTIATIMKSENDTTKNILELSEEYNDGFDDVYRTWQTFNNSKVNFLTPLELGNQSDLKLMDSDSSNYVSFVSSESIAYNQLYVMPNSTGTLDDVMSLGNARSDGRRELKWKTLLPSGGGGASSLGVYQNGVSISSPTNQINFISPPFSLSLGGASTATVRLDASSVTLQGNSFNAANKLVQLSGSNLISNSLIDGSSITKQGLLVAGSNITLTPGAGTLTIASTGGGGGGVTVYPATSTIISNAGGIQASTGVFSSTISASAIMIGSGTAASPSLQFTPDIFTHKSGFYEVLSPHPSIGLTIDDLPDIAYFSPTSISLKGPTTVTDYGDATAPSFNLIGGSSNTYIMFRNNSVAPSAFFGSVRQLGGDQYLSFGGASSGITISSEAAKMNVTSTSASFGYFGLNISTPQARLHVNGTAIVESTFTLRTSTVVLNGTTYYWKAGTGSSGQYLMTDGATTPTLTFTTPAGGGGGASPLGVFQDGVQKSSPTSQINFLSPINVSLGGSSTATVTLNGSSVTLGGVFTSGQNIAVTPGAGITTVSLSGIVSAANFVSTCAYTTSTQTFSGVSTFTNVGNSFTGIGTGLLRISSLTATGVTAGSYTNTNLTVSGDGRITSASNGSSGTSISVYPATSTIIANAGGIQASTGVFTSTISASAIVIGSGTAASPSLQFSPDIFTHKSGFYEVLSPHPSIGLTVDDIQDVAYFGSTSVGFKGPTTITDYADPNNTILNLNGGSVNTYISLRNNSSLPAVLVGSVKNVGEDQYFSFAGSANGLTVSSEAAKLNTTTTSNRFGYLGLFISTPNARLHVNGDAIIESTFTVTKSTIVLNGTTYYWNAGAGSNGQFLKTDGAAKPTLTWGTAGGSSGFNYTFPASQANLPGANAPYISNSTNAASAGVFFDETSTQTVTWSTMLNNYNSGTLYADIIYTSSATSGTMNWGVYIECKTPSVDALDYDTDSFSTVNSTSVTVGATAGMAMKASVTLTNQDSCANGDTVRVKLERRAGETDTAIGKGRVRFLRLYE